MNKSSFIVGLLWFPIVFFGYSGAVFAEPADEPIETEESDESEDIEQDTDQRLAKADTDTDDESLAKADSGDLAKVDETDIAKVGEQDLAKKDATSSNPDQSLEDEKAQFFLKAFGKEMPTTFYEHALQVVLDKSIGMDMIVEINPFTQAARFNTEVLVAFLRQNLLPEPMDLRFGENLSPTLSDELLRELGFEVEVNLKYERVEIRSPMAFRKNVIIYLGRHPKITNMKQMGPQPISGYLNTSHAIDRVQGLGTYDGQYRLNVNVEDWLVQSEARYTINNGHRATLSGGRVVKDLAGPEVRLTMGDNSSPNADLSMGRMPLATGFQQPLFGVDVGHIVNLNRRLNIMSEFSYPLLMESDARVVITLNGRIIFFDLLYSGKYDLQGFPFQVGKNEILIQYVNANGAQEEIQVEYFHNPTLLRKGDYEYQFASGVPYSNAGDMTEMDPSRYTNLAYWRHGIDEKIGATGYLQTVGGGWVGGVMGEYGVVGSILSAEVALSRNAANQRGQAVRVQAYTSNASYLQQGRSFLPSYYSLNVNSFSRDFDASLMNPNGSVNDLKHVVSPAMVWVLGKGFQVQVNGIWRDNYAADSSTAVSVRSFYRTKQVQWRFSLEKSVGGLNDDLNIFTMVTWRPKERPRDRYAYRYNNRSQSHNLSGSIRPVDNKHMNYQWNTNYIDTNNIAFDGSAQYQTIGQTLSTGWNYNMIDGMHNNAFKVGYNGARAFVDANHARRSYGSSTGLRVETAIAFVGEHWGISRPINESFAILYPNNDGLKESKIRFNDGSVLDKYSAAVYPFLRNYQGYEMSIYSADVPIGIDLGRQQYSLNGRLNSGQAIPIGKPGGIIMAQAVLLKPNGMPYDLEVGNFVYVKDPELTVQFFTNRSGKLFVHGLKAGEYRVELLGDTYIDFTLIVPDKPDAPVDLGTITLQRKPAGE